MTNTPRTLSTGIRHTPHGVSELTLLKRRSIAPALSLLTIFAFGCGDDDIASLPDATFNDGGIQDSAQAVDGGAADSSLVLSPFQQAVAAIGGEAALTGLQRLQIDAAGDRRISFEAEQPNELIDVSSYTASYMLDLADNNLRVDATRTPLFEAFQFFPAEPYTLVLQGNIGGLSAQVGFTPAGNLPSQSVGALRTQQRLFNPFIYLREGLADLALISDGGAATFEGRAHRIIAFAGQVTEIRLFVDDATGFISKLETLENSPLVRDTSIEVRFGDWQSRGSLAFPNAIELLAGGLSVHQETRSAVIIDPSFSSDVFDLPAAADSPVLDPGAFEFGQQSHQLLEAFFHLGFGYSEEPMIVSSELTPRLRLLSSAAANTLAIRHDGGLVVLEAPASPQHGTNLIASLNTTFPGEAITHVVQSHHHVDHASGVRSLVAAGAIAVVGNGFADFWREVLSAPSTIRPDALAAASVTPVIEEVPLNGTVVVEDETVRVTVHHISANPHGEGMVLTVVEVGGEMYVYQADLYNAGFGFTLVIGGPESLFAILRDLEILDASCASAVPLTIIPAHGTPLSLADSLAELTGLGVDVSCPE